MKTGLIESALFFAALSSCLYAQDEVIDENALFSDTSMFVDSTEISASFSMGAVESTQMSFSGEITSAAEISAKRDYFKNGDRKTLDPGAYVVGNFLLDARFPAGIKAFANAEAHHLADSGKSRFYLQEIFVDANINRRVYFRTGKQVLQWGRCFFWNPTDLINIEKKKFIQDIGYREGTYGIKMHIPVGTRWNFYTFLDMNRLTSVDSLAGAAKVEFLLGNTEVGTALWVKENRYPYLGIDFSTSLFDISFAGEASLTSGDNYTVFVQDTSSPLKFRPATINREVVARVCLSASKMFDLMNVDDRVSVNAEVYYNQAGYTGNKLRDYDVKDAVEKIMELPESDPMKSEMQSMSGAFLEPNNHSRLYGALFMSISKFIISDLTLTVNGILNFNHRCAVISTGLQYRNLHNFSLGFLVNAIVGPEESEYTLFDDAASLRLTAGVSF